MKKIAFIVMVISIAVLGLFAAVQVVYDEYDVPTIRAARERIPDIQSRLKGWMRFGRKKQGIGSRGDNGT